MEYKIMHEGNTEKGYGEKGLILDQIFSIRKEKEDTYLLTEECDGWFKETPFQRRSFQNVRGIKILVGNKLIENENKNL